MPDYYKLSGTVNRHTDWTTEVVLARDEKTGEPTKVVSVSQAAELTAEDRKAVEGLGYKLEQVSKSEADAGVDAQAVDANVSGSAPVFGVSDAEMRPASDPGSDKPRAGVKTNDQNK